jgi:hypothetical protein
MTKWVMNLFCLFFLKRVQGNTVKVFLQQAYWCPNICFSVLGPKFEPSNGMASSRGSCKTDLFSLRKYNFKFANTRNSGGLRRIEQWILVPAEIQWGTLWHRWLRRYATSQNVAGSWPWDLLSIFTEMSTRRYFWGKARSARKADNLTAVYVPIV